VISHVSTVPGTFQLLTWDGTEEEIREFAGDRFLRLDDDGVAYCVIARNGITRFYPGDHVLKLEDASELFLWIVKGSKWLPALFGRES
jgi:hypothetical protein